jgi:O-antigen/teichoic acid export membrane protein
MPKLFSTDLRRWFAGTTLIQIGGLLATTLIGVILARGLGVQGYGGYGIALAIVTILCIPGELGLAKLVMREVGSASARGDASVLRGALAWSTRTALLACAAILVLAAVVLVLLGRDGWSETELSIAIGLPLIPLTVFTAIQASALMGLNGILRAQIPVYLIRPLALALLLLALFVFSSVASPAHAMALNVLSALVAWATVSAMQFRAMKNVSRAEPRDHGRKWLVSSLSMAAIDGLRTVQGQIGILLVGIFATSADAGIFRVAASAALFVSLPVTLIETVSAPLFARLTGTRDHEGLQSLAGKGVLMGFGGVAAATLAAAICGRPLIQSLFGTEYLSAYGPFLVLCFAQLVSASFGMNASLLIMSGGERPLTRAVAAALIVNVVLAASLVPVLGATGAALGSVGYFLVWNVLASREVRRFVEIETALWHHLFRRAAG